MTISIRLVRNSFASTITLPILLLLSLLPSRKSASSAQTAVEIAFDRPKVFTTNDTFIIMRNRGKKLCVERNTQERYSFTSSYFVHICSNTFYAVKMFLIDCPQSIYRRCWWLLLRCDKDVRSTSTSMGDQVCMSCVDDVVDWDDTLTTRDTPSPTEISRMYVANSYRCAF